MVRSASVIFDTGDNYSCYSNKGDNDNIGDKMSPRNLKSIEKGLDIYGFGLSNIM